MNLTLTIVHKQRKQINHITPGMTRKYQGWCGQGLNSSRRNMRISEILRTKGKQKHLRAF